MRRDLRQLFRSGAGRGVNNKEKGIEVRRNMYENKKANPWVERGQGAQEPETLHARRLASNPKSMQGAIRLPCI